MTIFSKEIGARIRQLRKQLGLTQMELAEKIGISFQQIQKYENAITNMPITRLHDLSKALGVDVTFFTDERIKIPKLGEPSKPYSAEENWLKSMPPLSRQEATLLKLFRKINNKKVREGVIKQLRGSVELEKKKQPDFKIPDK